MSQAELDQLLERMPAIASAVEQFKSETIQGQVLQALIEAFRGEGEGERDERPDQGTTDDPSPDPKAETNNTRPAKKAAARKSSGSKTKQSFTLLKDLDLIRGGSQSLKDFVAAKKPGNVLDKVLVSVYWLTRIRSTSEPATLDQVYTCFKHMAWPIPSDLANTTQQAGAKGWLDSSKRDDLKVVINGENRVEHELPGAAKS